MDYTASGRPAKPRGARWNLALRALDATSSPILGGKRLAASFAGWEFEEFWRPKFLYILLNLITFYYILLHSIVAALKSSRWFVAIISLIHSHSLNPSSLITPTYHP